MIGHIDRHSKNSWNLSTCNTSRSTNVTIEDHHVIDVVSAILLKHVIVHVSRHNYERLTRHIVVLKDTLGIHDRL